MPLNNVSRFKRKGGLAKRTSGAASSARSLLLVGVASLWVVPTLITFHLHASSSDEDNGLWSPVAASLSRDERGASGRDAPGPTTRTDARDAPGGGRRVYRYDEVLRSVPGTARSHALPNAVPPARQIPRARAADEAYHIAQRTNTSTPSLVGRGRYNEDHAYDRDFRTLYLYNPSVLALHNTVPSEGEADPDLLSQEDLEALTGGDSRVRYLASYRAYLGCNCFGTGTGDGRRLMRAGEQLSYLALALLDDALDVIAGTDVLIDLNAGPAGRKYFRQSNEDCRLFLLRGGIYLLCNEEMKRVRIERATHNTTQQTTSPRAPGVDSASPGDGKKKDIPLPYRYPNMYGDGMAVTILAQLDHLGSGKNFNIFRTGTTYFHNTRPTRSGVTPGMGHEYYLQLHPAPHQYQKLDIEQDPPVPTTKRRPSRHPLETAPGELPGATFDTPDTARNISWCPESPKLLNCTAPTETPFFSMAEDHGTACCVGATLAGREVLVGIAHQKLSQATNFWLLDVHRRYRDLGVDQFVSRFVAYAARPPFTVVARSGWFCLGFAAEDESSEARGNRGSTLAGLNTHARLDLFHDTFDCPVIHFASGFSEAVGNASRAIIGYGINDCHPRMFFVEKEEIVKLLTMA